MTTRDAGIALEVKNAVKVYGSPTHGVTALKDVSVDIMDNEFFTLLGPSGCGKTTLLRLFAGFEAITDGKIFLFGEDIHDLPANRRPINTVFQQYALFPHMSVLENVEFGLKMLDRKSRNTTDRAREMLALVQLTDYGERKPSQLSGGQQQRVALARALAPAPKVLLLDEPLSALDLKLRKAMRVELKQIQEDTGITFVFVTHDQEEALTMSDRIAVMSAGEIQQIGSAREIYEEPINRFVADFIGETNLLEVTVEQVDGDKASCILPGGNRVICDAPGPIEQGRMTHVSIRPERLSICADHEEGQLSAAFDRFVYLGTDLLCMLHLDDGEEITLRSPHNATGVQQLESGSRVGVRIEEGAVRLLVD